MLVRYVNCTYLQLWTKSSDSITSPDNQEKTIFSMLLLLFRMRTYSPMMFLYRASCLDWLLVLLLLGMSCCFSSTHLFPFGCLVINVAHVTITNNGLIGLCSNIELWHVLQRMVIEHWYAYTWTLHSNACIRRIIEAYAWKKPHRYRKIEKPTPWMHAHRKVCM